MGLCLFPLLSCLEQCFTEAAHDIARLLGVHVYAVSLTDVGYDMEKLMPDGVDEASLVMAPSNGKKAFVRG